MKSKIAFLTLGLVLSVSAHASVAGDFINALRGTKNIFSKDLFLANEAVISRGYLKKLFPREYSLALRNSSGELIFVTKDPIYDSGVGVLKNGIAIRKIRVMQRFERNIPFRPEETMNHIREAIENTGVATEGLIGNFQRFSFSGDVRIDIQEVFLKEELIKQLDFTEIQAIGQVLARVP